MGCLDGGVDRAIEVLRANEGVLTRRRHSRATINALLRDGAIVRVLPGVFVDAGMLTDRRTRYAAALARHPLAVLWAGSASAAIANDTSPFVKGEVIQLAQPTVGDGCAGVRLHRRVVDDVRLYNGLRCPPPAVVAVSELIRDNGRSAELFLRTGLARPTELVAALAVFDGSRGQALRRTLLRGFADNPWSGGERDLQGLLRREGVDGWVANAAVIACGYTYFPDLLFAAARLVVEFDGFEVHGTRQSFEADRIRQNRLVLAGFRVLRYTWQRLQDDPRGIVAEIKQALTSGEPQIC